MKSNFRIHLLSFISPATLWRQADSELFSFVVRLHVGYLDHIGGFALLLHHLRSISGFLFGAIIFQLHNQFDLLDSLRRISFDRHDVHTLSGLLV